MAEVELERQYSGREVFDAIFTAVAGSGVIDRIRQDAYGEEYPVGAEPFSALFRTELDWFARELRSGPGSRVLDVACGRGGPGRWIAQATGARLTGIDYSRMAVVQAAASRVGAADFVVCDAARLGIRAQSHDAAMSIDSLQLMREREDVLREVARVLRRGGRFVFSTWENREPTRPGESGRIVHDHEPLLFDAGLTMIDRREPPGWLSRQLAYLEGLIAHSATLVEELGEPVTRRLLAEATQLPARLKSWKKVVIICQRR